MVVLTGPCIAGAPFLHGPYVGKVKISHPGYHRYQFQLLKLKKQHLKKYTNIWEII